MPLEENCFTAERQVGFPKPTSMLDQQVGTDRMVPMPGSNLVASSPMAKLLPIGAKSMDCLEQPQAYMARARKENLLLGVEETTNLSKNSWSSTDHRLNSLSNAYMQPASYGLSENKSGINMIQHESSLFSSSLSDIFSRKMSLFENNVRFGQPANVACEEEEPFESLKDIEAHTIGNLLPDEEDLFSGIPDEPRYNAHMNKGDDLEDFDLFSSGGGMELEGDARGAGKRNFVSGISNNLGVSSGSIVGEHPYGEHPSRTLFVRNINSTVEDSVLKNLFEQYGDIRSLYTHCKQRGFVMISYYDLRAAQGAMKALQNIPLSSRKLDIHFSIPKDNPSDKDINQGTVGIYNLDLSVSNDDLHKLFGVYGEIKEIRETPHKNRHKFIEFYDTRAAEAARRALNRSDVSGKQIGCSMQSEPNQDQETYFFQSPCEDSSSGLMGYDAPGIVLSSCMDNGSIQGLHSVIGSPMSSLIENVLPLQRTSVSNPLSSPVGVGSIGNQFGLHESILSLDEMKFSNQQNANSRHHSFTECNDSLAKGIPFNVSSTVTNLGSYAGLLRTEGIEGRHIRGMTSNGHSMEFNGGIFGSSGNGDGPIHGHNYTWSNPNSYQHDSLSPMIWPNSPSFVNSVHARHLPQLPGFPRPPAHMVRTGSPIHHHLVGSAPSVNPTLWDRKLAFKGESAEASGFQSASLGSGGFPGGSPFHTTEVSSHNIFSHVGGNCIDMIKNAALRSSQHMCPIFPGKNPIISVPASFDYPNERGRNLLHRRNEATSNYTDKKQYELDIDRILRAEDSRTTLMIKNIPNKYTSKMLLAAIDEHCRGTYDFIYLPIDFKNKCNVGYAFINMIDPKKIVPFHQAFNGNKWEKFNSEKVATLAYARIQGKSALIAHFQNSSLMNEDKRCRPILFHTDGPNVGDQEPFPTGGNIRSRSGKPRTSGFEENHDGNPSISPYGEESSNGMDSSSGSSKDFD